MVRVFLDRPIEIVSAANRKVYRLKADFDLGFIAEQIRDATDEDMHTWFVSKEEAADHE